MSEQNKVTVPEMLNRINAGWSVLQDFIHGLTEDQLTVPTDSAGWTVKDHLMHLAVWQNGITALLNKQSRYDAMGLDRETFLSGDYDRMNAIIQQQHKDEPLTEVLAALDESHQSLSVRLQSLTDEDLMLPYSHYAPDSERQEPVFGWIVGNTFEHYSEHIPWMASIAER